MNSSKIYNFIKIFVLMAFLLTCNCQQGLIKKRVGMIFPSETENIPHIANLYGDVLESKAIMKKPQPIPGRILVKFKSNETAKKFKIDILPEGRLKNMLEKYKLIPTNMDIKKVEYIGQTQTKNSAFIFELNKPGNVHQIEKNLRGNDILLISAIREKSDRNTARHVLVELKGEKITRHPDILGKSDFNRIREKSPLRHVLDEIGIQSIRRVFRATEVRSGDFYEVLPLKNLLQNAATRYPLRKSRAYQYVDVADNMENWFILRLKPGFSVEQAILKLKSYGGVEKVCVDFPLIPAQPPAQYVNQWGLNNTGQTGGTPGEDINIEPAWLDGAPIVQSPIVVAVIDEGFKEDLDQFVNRLWANTNETVNGIDDDCNGYVDDIHGMTCYDPWAIIYEGDPCTVSPGGPSEPFTTHGTKVAGIIAADHSVSAASNPNAIAGTAGDTDVRLMNLVVGNCAAGSPLSSGVAEMAEALFYAIDNGADIANISMSCPMAPIILQEAVQMALDNGLIIVASAGNDGIRFTKSYGTWNFAMYPACLPGVINVGGINHFGQWWSGSNYGPGLDLVAPAENIRTITYSSPDQTAVEYIDVNGTSLSAAFVSGAAAIILSKYPSLSAPYMRQWLKATARDITDPRGSGDNLIGDDEWTGSGMLDVGAALAALASSNDQPINVDIYVERFGRYHYSSRVKDAVAGNPDLGITVTTPQECIAADGSNTCINNWRLEYGVGDFPTTWTPITISNPSITSNSIDVVRTADPQPGVHNFIEVESGYNYLNTDQLTNNELYTVRLVAENNAVPRREFIAYDWIIPTRANLIYPFDKTTLVGKWGLGHYYGFSDIRNGAIYRLAFNDNSGTMLWTGPDVYPSQLFVGPNALDPAWGTWASAYMELMGEDDQDGTVPLNPAYVDPATYPEGWITCNLEVTTATGALETASASLYLDNSHFPQVTGWPVDVKTETENQSYANDAIFATDMGGGIGYRIFIYSREKLLCFSPDGALLWEIDSIHRPFTSLDVTRGRNELPDFAIDDINNDGIKEIVFQSYYYIKPPPANALSTPGIYIYVIDHNGNVLPNWPKGLGYNVSGIGSIKGITKIHIADISGSNDKEIIFYKKPLYYYGINENDITPGVLYAMSSDGQELWTIPFPPEIDELPMETGDIDNDTKDEILLEPDRILEGDGTFKPGWDTEQNPNYLAKLVDLNTSTPELEIVMYPDYWSTSFEVRAVDISGNDLPGWPQQITTDITYDSDMPRPNYTFITFAQLVDGGDPEVIIGGDKINVLASDGQQIPGMAPIDINGICEAIKPVDNDNNGVIDTYYTIVLRWRRNMPATERKGYFLEAYQPDGTNLSDSDNRWPIIIDGHIFRKQDNYYAHPFWNGCVSAADIDNDNVMEVIHLKRIIKYTYHGPDPDTRIEIYDVQ